MGKREARLGGEDARGGVRSGGRPCHGGAHEAGGGGGTVAPGQWPARWEAEAEKRLRQACGDAERNRGCRDREIRPPFFAADEDECVRPVLHPACHRVCLRTAPTPRPPLFLHTWGRGPSCAAVQDGPCSCFILCVRVSVCELPQLPSAFERATRCIIHFPGAAQENRRRTRPAGAYGDEGSRDARRSADLSANETGIETASAFAGAWSSSIHEVVSSAI